jgi:ribosomal protein L7Ae-like RNA K-turn-binding protein
VLISIKALMSRKPRLHQKQTLRLDSTISLPPSKVVKPDPIIALLQSLHRADHLIIGINSVGRALIRGEIAILLFASNVDPPDLVTHLLQIAAQANVPVIATGIDARDLGKGIGFRSATVIGILSAAGEEVVDVLLPFTVEIPPPRLPFLKVETDFFPVGQRF